jgi:hypothetical protein
VYIVTCFGCAGEEFRQHHGRGLGKELTGLKAIAEPEENPDDVGDEQYTTDVYQ